MMLHLHEVKRALFDACLNHIADLGLTPYIAVDSKHELYVGIMDTELPEGMVILNLSPSAVNSFYVEHDGLTFNYAYQGSRAQAFVPWDALVTIFAKEDNTVIQSFPIVRVDTVTESVKVPTKPKRKGFQPRIIPGGKA